MAWCLLPKDRDRLKQDLLDGTLNPVKLSEMSSDERRNFFSERLGKDNAEQLNRQFEAKLLLKNQQRGYISWAEKLLVPPEIKRDIINRIKRLDTVLSPTEEKRFLEDLAAHRLGARVSFEEAATITELSNAVQANEDKKGSADYDERMEYGRAVVALTDYVNNLKIEAQKAPIGEQLRNPVKTAAKAIVKAPGFFKSIQSAFDNSAVFRQGWKTMWSHPAIWARNAKKTFKDIYDTFGNKPVAEELRADIFSRPNYDLYRKAKLDVGAQEEAFPSSLPEKIPFIRKLYKASENAYTGFLHKTRADVFDKLIDVANNNDVELTEQELINIGRLVNSLTGRGNLGKLERAGDVVNVTFFSPRNLKGHIDALTQPLTGGATISELATGENTGSRFVRKEAAKNLLKTVGGTAVVLVLARAIAQAFGWEDPIELDPRSANFGKIKIGNTRFDVTGGAGSIYILAARLADGMSKSSTSEKMTDLTEGGYGKRTRLDEVEDFLQNKLSPIGQVVRDWAKGERFGGERFTYGQAALDLITPLPIKNAIENWKEPKAAPFVLTLLADGLGIGTNTYGKKKPKNDDSLKERVRTGKITLLEAKRELQDQVDTGKITNAQRKAQERTLTVSSTAEEAAKFRPETDADFDAMDEFAAELSTSDKETVQNIWTKKLFNLEKDGSPKSQDAADKLRMVITKHFGNVVPATPEKLRTLINKAYRASTDEIVNMYNDLDLSEQQQNALKQLLKEKALKANKSGTLTVDELKNIKKVLPDFDLVLRPPRPRSTRGKERFKARYEGLE